MDYEVVIGLEIHAQLLTDSKIFCGCSTRFGAEQNTQVCPVCTGMPGVLPVLNRKAVEYAIRMALATDCRINLNNSRFARKNYFYPDLPKGYQISQYELPLAHDGEIRFNIDGMEKRVGITRIHLEEDAGKLLHGETPESSPYSFVDLNRAGVPLIEIVTEPDIRSSDEAVATLKTLRNILLYLEICDCNMEEGSLRCDANVSIRRKGDEQLGTKTEVKNMNSFRFLKNALDYEIERQIEIIEDGGEVIQETRLWDSQRGVTISMRGKEEAHDYRYFPEPDLLPIPVDKAWLEEIRQSLPELPREKCKRFVKEYAIPQYDADVLTSSRSIADFFEACVRLYNKPKVVSNWIMSELLRELKKDGRDIRETSITPENLTEILRLIDDGTISGKIAKIIFEEVYRTGRSPKTIVKEKGLVQITDRDEIRAIVEEVLEANPKEAETLKNGKQGLIGFFVGQVMRRTSGKANPQLVNQLIREILSLGS